MDSDDQTEQPEEAEVDAVLLACTFAVQCLECGNTYTDEFSAQDEERDWEIQCVSCSEDKGYPVFIPLAGYAGVEAVTAIEYLEADAADEEQEGEGPAFGGNADDGDDGAV